MVTNNVYTRVFYIKYDNCTATCFSIDFEGKQYFITAKHVIESMASQHNIELFYDERWNVLNAKLVGHSSTSDVSVFALNFIIEGLPIEPTMGEITLGQDIYFLGFPFGIFSDIGELNRGFPFPFIKKGILSAVFFDKPGKPFYLDGINNPGFSGGPVVFKKLGTNDFRIAGVISGYRPEYHKTILNDKPNEIQSISNTGIIHAFSIDNAIDIIKDNPIGQII